MFMGNVKDAPQGDTLWCGPSALSALTGLPYARCKARLAHIEGTTYNGLKETFHESMLLALREEGFSAFPVDIPAIFKDARCGPKIPRFMATMSPLDHRPMLIGTHDHWIAAHPRYDYLCDGWTVRTVRTHNFPKPGRFIKLAWAIERTAP
jgi:hypothetical protein